MITSSFCLPHLVEGACGLKLSPQNESEPTGVPRQLRSGASLAALGSFRFHSGAPLLLSPIPIWIEKRPQRCVGFVGLAGDLDFPPTVLNQVFGDTGGMVYISQSN